MARILLAEANPELLGRLAASLLDAGHAIFAATTADEACEVFRGESLDLVLLNLRFGSHNGLELLERFKSWDPAVEAIAVSDVDSTRTAVRAMRLGACDVLSISATDDYVLAAVHGALRARSLSREVERLRTQLPPRDPERLLEPSSAMVEVRRLIRKAAASNVTVLITGESGVGKEIVARDIVAHSDRATAPLVTVDAGALPESLTESELFGHERGAFTGATTRKLGRLELADGGSVLFDEIGNLPSPLQPRLLRVIETCEVLRLGATRPVRFDIRFLAATNADLDAMVAAGSFREDLFHRLSVFPIRVPPLRERPADILPFVDHFLVSLNKKHRKQLDPPDLACRRILEAYTWPGNIRELRNVIERAVILAEDRIEPSHLIGLRSRSSANAADAGHQEIVPLRLAKDEAAAQAASTMIERALSRTGGDKKQAARLLGVSLKTLYNHLASDE